MRPLGDTMSTVMDALIAPSTGNDSRSGYAARGPTCPCCRGGVLRIRRRWVDLLVSFFTPIRRFRCRSTECGWEGNLRVKRLSLLR